MRQELMTVLLIVGDARYAEQIRKMLSQGKNPSVHLEHVGNLSEALARLPDGGIDLVLLDLSLREGGRLEPFLAVYRSAPYMPVILLTSPHQEKLALKAVRGGAQDYFVKGQFDGRQLLRAIHCAAERNRMQRALRALSLTDDLTGLRNRRGFFVLGEQQLRLTDRNGGTFSILFTDLDGLKQINDTHGHAVGDEALLEAAEVLKETVRGSDIIARLAGDEFVALLVNTSGKTLENLLQRLERNIQARNHAASRCYQLSLSIGVATYDSREPCSLSSLLARADASMYAGKYGREGSGWTEEAGTGPECTALLQPDATDSTLPSSPPADSGAQVPPRSLL